MKFTYPLMMASAMSVGSARAINENLFEGPVLEVRQNAWKAVGCYSSAGDLTKNGTNIYQSSGKCEDLAATKNNAKVIGLTNGDTCYYGDKIPGNKVDDSKCNKPCAGYDKEMCGGSGAFLVWANGNVPISGGSSGSDSNSNNNNNNNNNNDDDSDSSSSPTPTPTPTPPPTTPQVSVITNVQGDKTVFITNSPEAATAAVTVPATSSPKPDSGGSAPKAAIAAGVVVGVVGLAAIVGGVLLFLRSKKQRQEAAELQRQSSSAGFASRGEKPPSTYSLSDSRLEPAFMRRMSDGSIADNQDYSRRILKVTNPDDR